MKIIKYTIFICLLLSIAACIKHDNDDDKIIIDEFTYSKGLLIGKSGGQNVLKIKYNSSKCNLETKKCN